MMSENVRSLKHIQIMQVFLNTIGAWPLEAFGKETIRKIYSRFLIALSCFTSFGEINYVAKNIHHLNFSDLGDIVMTMFLTCLTITRSFLPSMKSYENLINEFVTDFHLLHYKCKGGYYKKIYNKINNLSHYFTLVMVGSLLMGSSMFNVVPFYNNYMNGAFSKNVSDDFKLQFSVYTLYPGFNPEDYFTIATFFNSILGYICSVLVCGIDLLMFLMSFQIIGHIMALKYDLQHLPRPKRLIGKDIVCRKSNQRINLFIETYNDVENDILREKIVQSIEHHKSIVSFAGSVSQFFGPMLAFNYLYHLVSCGLLLVECSLGEPDMFARYGTITFITFCQLIQMSLTFEIIGSESMKLKDAVYNIPWECMNISNQKLVLMFLSKIQIPIRVQALGMADVGIRAMVAILKTTLSYFALLRSMNE